MPSSPQYLEARAALVEQARTLRLQGLSWRDVCVACSCGDAIRKNVLKRYPELRQDAPSMTRTGTRERVHQLVLAGHKQSVIAEMLACTGPAIFRHVRNLRRDGLLSPGPGSGNYRRREPSPAPVVPRTPATIETRPCSCCRKPIPRVRGCIWCGPCRSAMQAQDHGYAI